MDITPQQQALVQAAISVEGWTAPEPRYLTLIMPWEMANNAVQSAEQMALQSDCGLVLHGIYEVALNMPARLRYVVEHAISDVLALAKQADAYIAQTVYGIAPTMPVPGDGLYFGAAGNSSQHMTMVIAVDGNTFTTMDGGERTNGSTPGVPAGLETITRNKRVLVRNSVTGLLHEQATGRPLLVVIDGQKMADYFGPNTGVEYGVGDGSYR